MSDPIEEQKMNDCTENKRKSKLEQLAEELFGEMRNATPEEQEILNEAIEKKSIATGLNIWDFWESPQSEWNLQYDPIRDIILIKEKPSLINRQAVYNKFEGHCAYCGKKIQYKDMQVDHILPKRSGGTDNIDNLFPTCRRCNHYKRANSIEGFRDLIEKIPSKLMRDNYIFKVGVDYGFWDSKNRKVEFYFEKYNKGDDDEAV